MKNERQYRITKAQADRFRTTLRELRAARPRADEALFRQVEIDAVESQLADLDEELLKYEQE